MQFSRPTEAIDDRDGLQERERGPGNSLVSAPFDDDGKDTSLTTTLGGAEGLFGKT